jgi:tetratricopeptide (TPR) repeat protein
MQDIQIRTVQRLRTLTYTGFAFLAMLLSVLAGCASSGMGKVPIAHEAPAGTESSVARSEDGLEGFIITEVPKMDEASRGDFDSAVVMLKDKDYGKAIDLLEKVIGKSPGITAPYIDIAIAYRHIGKPEKAEENLKSALKMFPGHPVACNEYGLLYRNAGRFADARAIYEKALARFPDYYPLQRNLGILCDLYLNDLDCALKHYEIYSNEKPEDNQVKAWIADLRVRLGRK